MPSKEHEALVEKVAKAISGPFHPVPEGSPYTLDQLRDIRWQQINDVERKLCLSGAKAVITTIRAALQEPDALKLMVRAACVAQGLAHNEGMDYRGLMKEAIKAAIAKSALGEQSDG